MVFFPNCVLTVFTFKSRINQISFSLSSVTVTPFQGTSSDELTTDSTVWVMIVAPLLTIIFISVVATLLFLFFRRRKCKIILHHVLRYILNTKIDSIRKMIFILISSNMHAHFPVLVLLMFDKMSLCYCDIVCGYSYFQI